MSSESINLTSLTDYEKSLCSVMWKIETLDQLKIFWSLLPKEDAKLAESLAILLQLEASDSVDSVKDAKKLLSKFK